MPSAACLPDGKTSLPEMGVSSVHLYGLVWVLVGSVPFLACVVSRVGFN